MNAGDMDRFATMLMQLFYCWPMHASKVDVRFTGTWWNALCSYPLCDVQRVFRAVAGAKEHKEYPPSIPALIERLEQLKRKRAWEERERGRQLEQLKAFPLRGAEDSARRAAGKQQPTRIELLMAKYQEEGMAAGDAARRAIREGLGGVGAWPT